ncbi:hypothetical protein, conserved [Plasmodium gonderi]|uniref:Uncharacterized protein n=1 Tax=Plasmodium gonderi TaxID=77519 RepID=A0A1Y1JN13_PLAGO|nr:hypothetical protein, conserved [Plasmodium gonderi]GAW83851.1 hypothetical protein, conserved [Plasmodium gonderi]
MKTPQIQKAFRDFLRILNVQEKNKLDESVLNELKQWGKEKVLKNDNVLQEYLNYKQVLNDYSQIEEDYETKDRVENIEKVANYVGLTTNYTKTDRSFPMSGE